MTANDGTIDITNFVELMRSSFVLSQVNAILIALASIPGLGWISAIPLFRAIAKKLIGMVVEKVANTVEMTAFFTATAIRKSAQANDYTTSIKKRLALPEDVDDETYEKAELLEIATFRRLVLLTN